MVQSRRFRWKILQRTEVMRRCLMLGIDEAHCVSYWGDSFRKQYSTVGGVRTFLPKGAPVVAVSATMNARVRCSVAKTLHFGRDYLSIDIGNDRPDISLLIAPMKHPMNTFKDLDFLVSDSYISPTDIPKTAFYCDNIDVGGQIIDYLTSRLRPEHRRLGLIRPFNATHSHQYRDAAMEGFRSSPDRQDEDAETMSAFKEGSIRILVCTDLFGMVSDDCLWNTGMRLMR